MASILIVVAAPDPALYGGQATVATEHARRLALRGHRVTLLTSDLVSLTPPRTRAAGIEEVDGYTVHHLHGRVLYTHLAAVHVPEVAPWMRDHAGTFDLAHIHLTREHLPIAAAFGAARAGLPFVVQMHGNLRRRKFHLRMFDLPFLRPPLRAAARVCALQETEAAQLRAVEPKARVTLLPNGIPLPAQTSWRPERLRSPQVLFVGRMDHEKRVLDVVEAAHLLALKGLRPRFRVIGPDAGDGPRAHALCAQYGVAAQFEFLGAQPHEVVLREMSEATVYVQPSVRESFSLTTFEAMACGVPSVVTTGNELAPVFRERAACAVIEPSAVALAQALQQLLGDPGQAQSLSGSGRALAQTYSIDNAIDRLEAIYAEVLGEHPRRAANAG